MGGSPEDTRRYDDIITLPHHVSTRHPHMPMADRAAQFSPFAALTGYGAVIKETARLTDQMPELTESEKALLDSKLRLACDAAGGGAEVILTYFVPDERKTGGAYRTVMGQIKKYDPYNGQIVMGDGSRVPIHRLFALDIQAAPFADG